MEKITDNRIDRQINIQIFNPGVHRRLTVLLRLAATACFGLTPTLIAAAPLEGTYPDCVVENSGDKPLLNCGDEIIDIRRDFDDALLKIRQRQSDAVNNTGILERYQNKLREPDRDRADTLSDMSELLAIAYPELYEGFVTDIAAIVDRAALKAQSQTEALVKAYSQFDPAAGLPTPVPVPEGNSFSEIIQQVGIENFIVSSEPEEITALEVDPPPIGIMPLVYSSIFTAGFFSLDASGQPVDYVDADTRFFLTQSTYCGDGAPFCIWPSGWDYIPYETAIVWRSLTLSPAEIQAIVEEDGYVINLVVNGTRFALGGPDAEGPARDYYAAALDPATAHPKGPVCTPGYQCIVTTIRRERLKPIPQPWRIQFEVERLYELDPPVIEFDPDSGESRSWVQARERFSSDTVTISPNETYGQSFFVEAISPSFKSDRCMDCHGFGTAEALALHHGWAGTGQVENFIADTDLRLEPSAYVDGAHVITCNNCHNVPETDDNGHQFEETEWKAPYWDLDVDWRVKSRAAICRRVLENLPTHEIRHQHFVEDARLYWAIEEPRVLGRLARAGCLPVRSRRVFVSDVFLEFLHC